MVARERERERLSMTFLHEFRPLKMVDIHVSLKVQNCIWTLDNKHSVQDNNK